MSILLSIPFDQLQITFSLYVQNYMEDHQLKRLTAVHIILTHKYTDIVENSGSVFLALFLQTTVIMGTLFQSN